MTVLFASTYPGRTVGAILCGASVSSRPDPERLERAIADYRARWGTRALADEDIPVYGPSALHDDELRRWWPSWIRFSATPGAWDKVGGLAVHSAPGSPALAGPGEVLVSSTVRDPVAGSGLAFAERGTADLKGVPGEWQPLRGRAMSEPRFDLEDVFGENYLFYESALTDERSDEDADVVWRVLALERARRRPAGRPPALRRARGAPVHRALQRAGDLCARPSSRFASSRSRSCATGRSPPGSAASTGTTGMTAASSRPRTRRMVVVGTR